MSSQKSTDELIARLARKPPPQSLWPTFPVVPLVVCLAFGLLVDAAAGLHQWEWSALTGASLTMALMALVTALFGMTLCLELVSPTGNLDLLVGAVAILFAALTLGGLSQAPALGMGQVMACYWLIVLMASPSGIGRDCARIGWLHLGHRAQGAACRLRRDDSLPVQ